METYYVLYVSSLIVAIFALTDAKVRGLQIVCLVDFFTSLFEKFYMQFNP